jgi:hypothetical protein
VAEWLRSGLQILFAPVCSILLGTKQFGFTSKNSSFGGPPCWPVSSRATEFGSKMVAGRYPFVLPTAAILLSAPASKPLPQPASRPFTPTLYGG